MTANEQHLNPALIVDPLPLYLYRLTLMKYADLSGAGAALAAGRWNRPGEQAIYTSLELATTVLERLAHTPKDKIPSGLAIMKIRVSGHWIRSGQGLDDRETLGRISINTSLNLANHTNNEADATHFALAVPSVILPVWNVVLYPRRRAFWEHVKLESVEPFHFDPRVFPEDAAFES